MQTLRNALQALWATITLPVGSIYKFLAMARKTFLKNKFAAVCGFLIAGIGTRFLEDGNLLVTSVLTLASMTITVIIWASLKKLRKLIKN